MAYCLDSPDCQAAYTHPFAASFQPMNKLMIPEGLACGTLYLIEGEDLIHDYISSF